jgi:DNA-binding transcriptional MocR family regulator
MEPEWTHGPTPIRRPVADRFQDVLESDGFPPRPTLPSTPARADSSEINLNAVTRAIEDLRRSGYRPLRPRPAALQPLSRSITAPSVPGGQTANQTVCPEGPSPMKEDGS